MKFTHLSVKDWRQFSIVELEIHPRLTVITGSNGAGKTTLLGLLTQHFGWHRPYLATPKQRADGTLAYLSGALKGLFGWKRGENEAVIEIGRIGYSQGADATLAVSPTGAVEYGVMINPQQMVMGIHIPSHRVASKYQLISSIPTSGINATQAFQNYMSEQLNRFMGSYSTSSPMFRMKEALISMATFGAGNEYVRGRPDLLESYIGFIEVLKKVLPRSLGFTALEIRTPDVVLITDSGEFLLDSVSGGIGAVIDLAWQIHTYSHQQDEFVVIIDEPENHLHPSMQRELLPNLLAAFPKVQFIVATHSPFIVTAVRDSIVNVLAYKDSDSKSSVGGVAPALSVYSRVLDHVNKAASANEVLRDVLGMDTTVPVWVAVELEGIVGRLRNSPLTAQTVDEVQAQLDQAGLAEFLPDAMDELSKRASKW